MIEIAARLGPVCQHLTGDEFAPLVSDVADTKLRFAAIDAEVWPRRDRDAGRQVTRRRRPLTGE